MSVVRRAPTRVVLLLVACVVIALGATPRGAVAERVDRPGRTAYTFTDLGVLGGLDSRAYALSSSGYAAGLADTSPGSWIMGFHAFRWTPEHRGAATGSILDLGAFADDERSAASGVNAAGVTVGVTLALDGGSTAFVYDDHLWALPGLGGGVSSADGINDRGQVTGSSRRADGEDHAVLWLLPHGHGGHVVLVDLGVPAGRIGSSGSAVNARGQVAGAVADADYYGYAAVWTPDRPHGRTGTWQELGLLPGGDGSTARDINRSGVVVGQGTSRHGDRGWIYDGRMRVLRPLPGGTSSDAYAINDRGDVVGSSNTADGSERAVLFRDGQVLDLNDFMPRWAVEAGYVLRSAHDINKRGQIVGVASVGGHAHGFLLTPLMP